MLTGRRSSGRGRGWILAVLLAVGQWACGEQPAAETPAGAEAAAIPRQPGLDVLLITIDTLRADALGSYGNPRASTPWIDRLAAAGVRFDQARAHNVVTLPAHASMLSGLYPQEHGVRDNSGFRFPEDLPTLAGILRQEGYRTGAFVSAFPLDSRFGLDRGFDVYEDGFVGAGPRSAFLEQERPGSRTVSLAKAWIASSAGPWFCWVHLYEPHFPHASPEPFNSRFRADPYLGEVAAADAALGSLLEPILAAEAGAQPLVVLTSDHGEALGEHGEATHGIFAYDSTLRVPLVLYQPRLFAPRVVPNLVRHIDLMPTILDSLALPIPENLHGRSLLRVAREPAANDSPPSYFEALSGQLNRGWAPLYGVLEGDTKYIELPIPELYILSSDPGELDNRAQSDPRRLGELRDILASLRAIDPGSQPIQEDPETLERLESLGYLSGRAERRDVYSEEDDPKRLIGLDAALREVWGLHEAGRLPAALAQARDLVRERPGMRIALISLAQLERESGNLEAAVTTLRQAYALNPADDSTLALLGSCLTQAGRAGEAVEITEPRSRLAAPDVDVLLVRALALARTNRISTAFEVLEKAEAVDPRNPAVPVHRGTLLLMRGDRAGAGAAYAEALALNPDTVAAHTALGILAVEDGRLEAGVEHWRRAVTTDPRQLSRLMAFGTHLWSRGENAAARPLLELFVASAPADTYGEEIARLRALLAGSG